MKKLSAAYPNMDDTNLERIDESVFNDPTPKKAKLTLKERKVGGNIL